MSSTESDQRVDEAIAAYLQACEAGNPPDRAAFLDAHPEIRDELRSFLDNREMLRRRGDATLAAGPMTAAPLGSVRYFGDYELLGEIARGGMGVVFRARQTSLNRIVALKLILAGVLAGEQDVARFRTEAEAAANLDHPNVCPIYEVGEHQGQRYYSMKLIAGGSLADRIATLVGQPREAAEILAKVADGVQHAHERGVLHRDLKPANVLLDRSTGVSPVAANTGGTPVLREETPYVSDFGLARRGADRGQTQTGQILGTPSYMAPEQAAARKDLTPACDVYALGAILYECLTGQPPFSGPSPLDVLQQAIDRPPVPPRQINARAPRDLETICMKCLEKEPARRYASARAFADDLRLWLASRPILARPAGAGERAWRWCRRNPVVAGTSAALLVLLVASSVVATAAAFRFDRLARQERQARGEADDAKKQARWQLARQYVSRGQAELEKGGVLASLPWYVEALALEEDDPLRAEVHRKRMGELLGHCPHLTHVLPHEEEVTQARLSDDGKFVLTIASAGRIWDAATGELLAGPWPAESADVAFSPDGRQVALVMERRCEVREVPSGRLLTTIAMEGSDSACAATWHPSGKVLALRYTWVPEDDLRRLQTRFVAARLFDAQTGKPLAPPIEAGACSTFWTRFSPDGKRLATITLRNVSDHDYRSGHGDRAFIEDPRKNYRGPFRSTVEIREGPKWADPPKVLVDDHLSLEFNPKDGTFVTTDKLGTGCVWERIDDRWPRKSFRAGDGFTRLRWSADGRHLLATDDKRSRWFMSDGKPLGPARLGFAPDWAAAPGRMVLFNGDEGMTLWHPLAGDPDQPEGRAHRIVWPDPPDFAQIGPDGRTLLTVRKSQRRVLLWDVAVRACDRGVTAEPKQQEPRYAAHKVDVDDETWKLILYDDGQDAEPSTEPLLNGKGATDQILSADQKRLYFLNEDGDGVEMLRGFDVPSGKARFSPIRLGKCERSPLPRAGTLLELRPGLLALHWYPTQQTHEVRLYEEGKHLGTLPLAAAGSIPPPCVLRVSPDGKTLAAVWEKEEVLFCRAWSLPDAKPRFDAVRMQGGLWREYVSISRDGRFLAAGLNPVKAGGSTGQVVDLTSGETVGVLSGGAVPRTFLSDGRLLVGSPTGTRLWDYRTGKPLTLPMQDFDLVDPNAPGGSHVLTGFALGQQGQRIRVAHDAQTGEAITLPDAATSLEGFPAETRPVERLRLLARVLSGRRLDPVGALVAMEPGEYAAAWQDCRESMPEARRLTADEQLARHRDAARVAESWRDWKAAEHHHRSLLERTPEDAESRQRLAEVLAEQGRWADARREYEEAAKRLPNPFSARADAALLALASGDRQRHRGDVTALLRDHAKTGSLVRIRQLQRLAALGSDAEAAGRALAIYPEIGNVYGGRDLAWSALAEARRDRPRALLAALRISQKDNGGDVIYLLLLAVVLKRAGESKEAAALLEHLKGMGSGNGWRERLIVRLLREEAARP